MKSIIEKGDRFGRLTAVRFDHRDKKSISFWLFHCDCGSEKVIRVDSVKSGHSMSCGCIRKEKNNNYKHGMARTKTYTIWHLMKQRCLNPNTLYYYNYGGRGITVCPRWLNSFENFYSDMGKQPKGKSLDRIDNNGNYCPENCRYATREQQMNNTRQNRLITYKNKTQNIKQWANELDIKYTTLYNRIYRGSSIKNALSTNTNL